MKNIISDTLLSEVALYYSDKLSEHGQSPRGVDWNGEESQILRFEQLCKIVNEAQEFSINDLGCGYGALYAFLSQQFEQIFYTGIDVSEDMINAAEQRYQNESKTRFIIASEPDKIADYSVASGIFNVRLGRSDAEWCAYLENTLDILNRTSRKGFSFNCLTSYSDLDKKKDYLYYADPCALFDLCKRKYSRNVALLHDYELYEFTILVRKHL
jgi:SAM-dependent methyltransferase